MQHKLDNGAKLDVRLVREGSDTELRIDGRLVGWVTPTGRFYVLGHDLAKLVRKPTDDNPEAIGYDHVGGLQLIEEA